MVPMDLIELFGGFGDMKFTITNVEERPLHVVPKVKRILFNPPATVVFWEDGTKTVVKCMEGETFSPYYGFIAALAKKIYGSNNAIHKMLEKWLPEEEEKPAKPKKEEYIETLAKMLTGAK